MMGESVYLHRPMLAVPIQGQFEQVLNARYLEREGYGLAADEINDTRLRDKDLLSCLEKTLEAAVSGKRTASE